MLAQALNLPQQKICSVLQRISLILVLPKSNIGGLTSQEKGQVEQLFNELVGVCFALPSVNVPARELLEDNGVSAKSLIKEIEELRPQLDQIQQLASKTVLIGDVNTTAEEINEISNQGPLSGEAIIGLASNALHQPSEDEWKHRRDQEVDIVSSSSENEEGTVSGTVTDSRPVVQLASVQHSPVLVSSISSSSAVASHQKTPPSPSPPSPPPVSLAPPPPLARQTSCAPAPPASWWKSTRPPPETYPDDQPASQSLKKQKLADDGNLASGQQPLLDAELDTILGEPLRDINDSWVDKHF